MPHCPYCGSAVRASDKFCIVCGKPMLTDLKDFDESPDLKDSKESKKDKEDKEEKKEDKKKSKKDKSEEEKTIKKKAKALPEEVKHQIDLYVEFNQIKVKKQILADKLDKFQKLLKDERYETDYEFAEEVNTQLKAIKEVSDALNQKAAEVKANMDDVFIIDRLENDIESKVDQLKNITREFKLKKLDKDIYQNLKETYKEEKLDLETEKTDLLLSMKMWISEVILERGKIATEQKLNQGRYKAEEITEEEYKTKDYDFEKKLKKLDAKVETLKKLTKSK